MSNILIKPISRLIMNSMFLNNHFLGSPDPRPTCPDGSDQAYCLYTVYTGAFVNTSLGLRITSQSECFCDLK